jgi:uncharacterized protein (TIGR03437 family)
MGLQAQTPVYATAQAAVRVIGQPDYTSNLPGEANFQLGSPTNMVIVGKKLVVSDGGLAFLAPTNNRILIYDDYTQVKYGAAASVVIGQPSFGDQCTLVGGITYVPPVGMPSTTSCTQTNAGAAGPTQNGMNWPSGLASDGQRLVIADSANNRLLIYNALPTSNYANADLVVGQANFTSMVAGTSATGMRQPLGVMIYAGKLYVADTQNNRVLIFNSIPTSSNAAADVVLGQANMTSRNSPAVASASTMLDPVSVTTDGTRLIVTDLGNDRILIWNHIPTANGTPADVVVGQPDFASVAAATGSDQMDTPRDAFSDGQRLIVSDSGNNRILVFNHIPTAPDAFPDAIIGQYDSIGHLEGLSAEKVANPIAMLPLPTGGFLVADSNNRRLLEFDPGIPLVLKYNIVDAASHNGNGLSKPVNVAYTTTVGVSGASVPSGTYYARVTALSAFPRESIPSDEIQIIVPPDPTNSTQLQVTWAAVPLATNYRVYLARIPGYEDRYQAADLQNATATPLVIGGTPNPGDSISITITEDDGTTMFTFTYTIVTGDTAGTIGDQLATGVNNDTSNGTTGVTATSDHKGTVTWAAKETGSIGNSCQYIAVENGTAATAISPNDLLVQFSGATDSSNSNAATLLTYVPDPTISGSFGNQRPLDNLVNGEIAQINGVSLAQRTITANTTPLPLQLGGTSVIMNGVVCPLVMVSPTQIQYQVPMELTGTSAYVQVQTLLAGGQTVLSTAVEVGLTLPQPGLYTADGSGIGGVMALRANGTVVTSNNPAEIGELVSFFGTGLGLLQDYPGNVSVTVQAVGGQLIPGSYFFRVTAIYPDGTESLGSGESLVSAVTGATNLLQITWDPTPGAQKYRVYVGTESLAYNRYYETDTNSLNLASIYGAAGFPPVQTNVPGNGQIHVATTIGVNVQTVSCPLTYTGPNPGVVGVWRITCQIPTTISASDLLMGANDTFGAAEVSAIVGAIDSNHVYLPIKRPPPTSFTQTPSQMFFTAVSGGTNPSTQPITVNKTGGGTLSWTSTLTTTDGGTWLTTDVNGGSNTATLNVSVDQTSLAVGTYTGLITVQGTDESGTLVHDSSGNPLTTSTTVTFTVTSSKIAPQRKAR